VDCYDAGATMLRAHMRDNRSRVRGFQPIQLLHRTAQAAGPKMILQVGRSMSFALKTPDAQARWLDHDTNDTRHTLTELVALTLAPLPVYLRQEG
jgi:hypothetical protein